ncbi:MAG: M48 family metalloprotease [Pseudohongiellaceae bacterium]
MSESGEVEIGQEEHEKILASQPVYEDEELLAYVTEVGNRVAATSHRPDLEYHFTIIDSPEINAFALPGGYVYVNRGLLTYMNNEAQLAAVLAHEIGHITARHSVQAHARGRFTNVAAGVGGFVTAVATGSGFIGSQISEVASIWAQTGLSGFGRELELEADRLGAEYLYQAGYDPSAVIDVVTVLKNQEDFNRLTRNNQGSYHGLFATHPRNDTRLHEAVNAVAGLSRDEIMELDDSVFRGNLTGLVVGESAGSRTRDDRNRYYQSLLGYTLVFPTDWAIAETTTTARATGELGSINIEAQRMQANIDPRSFIRERLGITNLQKSETLSQFGLLGHTGVIETDEGGLQRIGVIYLGPRAFILRGEIDAGESEVTDEEVDEMLLASIRSFRAIQRNEFHDGNELKIRYAQASEFFDFKTVGQNSKIAQFPEETLRLINGYYPTGTPARGDWIKLIE